MKAIAYYTYGSPDVLNVEEIEKPTPSEGEVLIKVRAASANPLDWHLMRGEPFLARLTAGLWKPKSPKLGADVAGVVEAVGNGVTEFRPGDEVFGDVFAKELGAFAEYVIAPEGMVALKPTNLSFEEAAAVPVAAFTALQGLRKGGIQAGQRVLINGAAGGVGTFSVQIAKALGAEVTGVCSGRNVELVRSIGADHVIDYTQADFTRSGQHYDLILDNVGNYAPSALKRALSPTGRCVIVGFTSLGLLFQGMLLGPLMTMWGSQKIFNMGTATSNKADLLYIKELLESGKVTPVIDRRYPLADTADAIRYLETGHARAKVVITI